MHSDSSCLLNSVLQITKTQQLRISKRVKDSKYGASLQTPQISSIKRPQDVPKHGLSRSLTHKTQRTTGHPQKFHTLMDQQYSCKGLKNSDSSQMKKS